MAKTKLEIIISVSDRASRSLGTISSGIFKLGAIGATAAVGGIAALSAGLVKLAVDSLPLVGIRDSFNALTSDIIGGSEGMLAAFDEATGGMLSHAEAMESYNLAASLVSETFAQQLPDAMGMLAKVSAATGEDLNFLVQSLTRGVGRLSPMILDNLAIQVDLNTAYSDYAAEIGKSVDSLTKQEQQTALMNQVMALLAENTAAMPDVTGTAMASWAALGSTLKNFRDEVGMELVPILGDVLGPLLSTLSESVLPRIMDGFRRFLPTLQAIGYVLAAIADGDIIVFWETLGNLLGEEVVGKIRELAGVLTGFYTETIKPFVEEHAEELKGAFLGVGTLLGGVQVAGAIAKVVGLLGAINPIVALIIGAAALLGAAWAGNWGGIRDRLMEVWATVQPVLSELWDWLKVKIVEGVQTAAQWFEETLIPALSSLWDWINTYIMPVLEGLVDVLGAILTPIVEGLANVFTEVLLPAIREIGDWLGNLFENTIKPLADQIRIIAEELLPRFADWLHEVAEKIRNMELPDWLTPGSPTPFELGLRGIGDAFRDLSRGAIPAFSSATGGISAPGVGGGGGGQVVINFTYAPAMSLGDRIEFETVVLPMIKDGLREHLGG